MLLAGQAKLAQQIGRTVRVVARPEAGLDERGGGGKAGKVRFLRQIPDRGAGLGEARARVGANQTGGDLQQGRLAGAVAPDQADAVAGGNGKLRPGQQRRRAERDDDFFQKKDFRDVKLRD